MRAGDLRHRITIQSESLRPDSMGGSTSTWNAFAMVWAAVWPLSGRERVVNAQLQSELTDRVRIRYLRGVTPRMRVIFGTRTLEILSVINWEERNVQLDLLCREVV